MAWASPAEAAWTKVFEECYSSAPSSNGYTTAAENTTGATLWYVGTAHFDLGEDAVVSDSHGNTYTATRTTNSSYLRVRTYRLVAPTTGAATTWTITGNSGAALCVIGYSGNAASPLDLENSNTASASQTVANTSLTPSEANTLICTFAGMADGYTPPPTIDQSFTVHDYIDRGSNATGAGIACLEQGAAAALTPTWTFSGAGGLLVTHMASFKQAAASSCRGGLLLGGAGSC